MVQTHRCFQAADRPRRLTLQVPEELEQHVRDRSPEWAAEISGVSAEEIVSQVRELEGTGLQQIMLLPSLDTQYPFLQRFSDAIIAAL